MAVDEWENEVFCGGKGLGDCQPESGEKKEKK